jgi:GntR family transcriptional regulator, transcriptional repressor for pyruvate dehydrogenase complex
MSKFNATAAAMVAHTLRREIVDGLADGEAIGSAQGLMERFQVSGPTVRQAMRVLEAEGLVRPRRGNSGGFFASTPSVEVVTRATMALLRRRGADFSDLALLSELLGGKLVALAAENPDETSRGRVLTYLKEVWPDDEHVTIDNALETGVSIPRMLGELSGSPTLGLMSELMTELFFGLVDGLIAAIDPMEAMDLSRRTHEGYTRVAQAVAGGDPDAAREGWQQVSGVISEIAPGLVGASTGHGRRLR